MNLGCRYELRSGFLSLDFGYWSFGYYWSSLGLWALHLLDCSLALEYTCGDEDVAYTIRRLCTLTYPVEDTLLLQESLLGVGVVATEHFYVAVSWSLGVLLEYYTKLGLVALTETVESYNEHNGTKTNDLRKRACVREYTVKYSTRRDFCLPRVFWGAKRRRNSPWRLEKSHEFLSQIELGEIEYGNPDHQSD